jgi:polyphosphate glucokinase
MKSTTTKGKRSRSGLAERGHKILAIDVGGTHVKVMCSPGSEKREFESGPDLTAGGMVARVRDLTKDWDYDVISIGYPGSVIHNRPLAEPHNLGSGWVGFDFKQAFGRPVKIVNDAAMQALGSYRGGLGTKKWRHEVDAAVARLTAALEPDYVVIGGGNAPKLKQLPANARLGNNENAFAGGFQLWASGKHAHG